LEKLTITADEEVELAQKIKAGIKSSKKLKANLRFVFGSKTIPKSRLTLPDLINEGNLLKAAQRFDETRGFKFISYAVWWIRQSIQAALAELVSFVCL
jgi:RNA polymerase primary sigma factor